MSKNNIETRHFKFDENEFRAYETDNGDKIIEGYAAVYNVSSRMLSMDGIPFIEIIEPGAFRSILEQDPDVIYNFNHEVGKVFARTKSGTLTLSEDEKGLKFRAKIDPNITEANDLYLRIKRGDIYENSFAFRASDTNQEFSYIEQEGNEILMRKITGFDGLFDVSSVTNAAYPNTSLNVRSIEEEIKNKDEINNIEEDENSDSERERLRMEVELKLIDLK